MRKPLIAATLGMLLLADLAHAQTLVATSNIIVRAFGRSIDFTSDTTTSIRDIRRGGRRRRRAPCAPDPQLRHA